MNKIKKLSKKLGKSAGKIINREMQNDDHLSSDTKRYIKNHLSLDTKWYIKKKKPYYVTTYRHTVEIQGRNGFVLTSGQYDEKRQAVQQAKRLAKNLGLEYRP